VRSNSLMFSIIVPTYNEENDIRETLESLVALDWPNKEIIIVDDSNDSTPLIVTEFAPAGVRLIKPDVRKGRCEARNIGIRASVGDVLVILNADVRLPANFLCSIAPLYENGIESVAVMNTIANQDQLYARFLEARRNWRIANNVYRNWADQFGGVFWTEAFSVRRDIAMKTNLFPADFSVPLEAGEDARFAEDLRKIHCKGVFAENIVVPHVAPGTLAEFWKIRIGRGAGTPQIRYFLDRWPMWKISAWRYAKFSQRLLKVGTLLPVIYSGYQLARHMPGNQLAETLRFAWVVAVEEAAKTVGEYTSQKKLKAALRT
jgi:glycosyltransferase involved in cell wall biosynthesis